MRDIPINVTAAEIVPAQGQRPGQPAVRREAEEAIALGQTLWQPAAVYDWFDVHTVEGEQVTLVPAQAELRAGTGSEAVLHVGPKANLLAAAKQVLVSVITIGPALEQHVHHLQAAGEHLKAYLLDNTGVVALGAVGQAMHRLAEEAAGRRGWGVSPSLGPGSLVGWPLHGQRDLCALLPLEQIGVRLNEFCVLLPHKSASSLIGLGPGYSSAHVGSVCHYCALQDTCWRRRKEPGQAPATVKVPATLEERS